MKPTVVAILVLVCILLAAPSCSSDRSTTGSVAPSQADLVGQIVEIYQANPSDTDSGALGAILVEGMMQGGTQDALVTVAVTKSTQLWQEEGRTRRPITFDALAVHQKVQITFIGPIAESYPMQATAGEIVAIQ